MDYMKKFILLVSLFFIPLSWTFAQTTVIDSLKNHLLQVENDSTKIEILLSLGKTIQTHSLEDARSYILQADTLAKPITGTRLYYKTKIAQAYIERILSNNDTAAYILDEILPEIIRLNDSTMIVRALNDRALIHRNNLEIEAAAKTLEQALLYAKSEYNKIITLGNLSNNYTKY